MEKKNNRQGQKVKATRKYSEQANLFTMPITDITQVDSSYEAYYPNFPVSDANNPVEFYVPPSAVNYMSLKDSFMYLKFKITKGDDNPIDNTSDTTPKQNLFSGVFSNLDVAVNGTNITSSSNNHAHSSYINRLVSNQEGKGRLLSELIVKETNADSLDSTNSAYQYIKKNCLNGQFELCSKIPHGLFTQDRLLPPKSSLRLRFRRSSDKFALYGATPTPPDTFTDKIHITDAILYIKKVVLHDELHAAHQHHLNSGKIASLPYDDFDVKSYSISKGSLSHTSENLMDGTLPSMVVVGMVDSRAYHGSQTKSPYNFKHFNLASINILVDGVPQIVKGINFNVKKNEYMMGYQMLKLASKHTEIEPTDFANGGYFLIAYDLRKALQDGTITLPKEGSLKLQLTFHEALDDAVNVIFYFVEPKILSIDGKNNVNVDQV